MNRDTQKLRDMHARAVRRYRDRVMREVLAGERPRTSIPKVNRERQNRQHIRNFAGPEGDKDAWTRAQKCEVTGADPLAGWKIDAAHMDARGMGGCGGGYRDIVPLVRWVHRDFDTLSEAKFAAKYGRTKESVRAMAQVYHQWYEEGV